MEWGREREKERERERENEREREILESDFHQRIEKRTVPLIVPLL